MVLAWLLEAVARDIVALAKWARTERMLKKRREALDHLRFRLGEERD